MLTLIIDVSLTVTIVCSNLINQNQNITNSDCTNIYIIYNTDTNTHIFDSYLYNIQNIQYTSNAFACYIQKSPLTQLCFLCVCSTFF